MSAFMVGNDHIDLMLTAASLDRYGLYFGTTPIGKRNMDHATWIGRELLKENVRSVHHRYNELPESIIEYDRAEAYTFRGVRPDQFLVVFLKAIDCYEYQSCEHKEWASSDAADFCNSLRRSLYRRLPGYDVAPWEWSRADYGWSPNRKEGHR